MGRARSDAFTLHQTGLGTVPSPVKLYSVNGAYDSKRKNGVSLNDNVLRFVAVLRFAVPRIATRKVPRSVILDSEFISLSIGPI